MTTRVTKPKDEEKKEEPPSDDVEKGSSSVKLSSELKAFYESHNVQGVEQHLRRDSERQLARFIRLNPRYDKQETLDLLESEIPQADKPIPISWLDKRFGFFALPGDFSLSQSKCFQSGRIYGMDVSSGAAVAALMSVHEEEKDLRVLDLCCCPGLKLCMIADLLPKNSTVVGVDVSETRLATCKNIVKKYHVSTKNEVSPRIRLYCADGTTFGVCSDPQLVFDSLVALEEAKMAKGRKRMNKSARARERKRLRQLSSLDMESSPNAEASDEPCTEAQCATTASSLTMTRFDRVLVDAECSTDGSLKHVQQQVLKASDATASNPILTDPKQLESLVELQKGLISSGFNLLKPGGMLVYSTCSLSVEQNEGVVQWLLQTRSDAFVMPVAFDTVESSLMKEGSIKGTLRFLPSVAADSNDSTASMFGGGFFVAKIGKRA